MSAPQPQRPLAKTRNPPVSLKEIDDFKWLETWSEWWSRHSVRAAREGGLFPDIYLRRYRDKLELSTGAEVLPGTPSHFRFLTPNRSYRVDLTPTARAMHQVLSAAGEELRRRVPQSSRVAVLNERIASLGEPTREQARMKWLAGIGDRFTAVANAVTGALDAADSRVRQAIINTRPPDPLVVTGSAYARLLYGAGSPTIEVEDVTLLTRHIIANYVEDASLWLSRLDLPLDTTDTSQLTPGEQGSQLGEEACQILGSSVEASWVDVRSICNALGVKITDIDLSDSNLRAVSVFGPTQRPHIFLNTRARWAENSAAQRFTLAHELCHLILDREYGDEVAIASGPWAPVAIEQRANAFAAAFLMPTWLLSDELTRSYTPVDDQETIRLISNNLHVSISSLVDRLYNLGELNSDERVHLRPPWPRQST